MTLNRHTTSFFTFLLRPIPLVWPQPPPSPSLGVFHVLLNICGIYREHLNTREGQPDGTTLDSYYFTLTTKGFRCYTRFELWKASKEGPYIKKRRPRCL